MAANDVQNGEDEVSTARFMPAMVVFLVAILVVPVIEIFHGTPMAAVDEVDWTREKVLKGESTKALEIALEEKSLFAETVRPLQAELLFRTFKEVTPKVLVGQNNWLFQASAAENFPRRGKEYLVDRHADAIVRMVRYLESRGIEVILLPVPPKWALYPEKLPDMALKPYSITPELLARFRDERIDAIDVVAELKKVDFLGYVPNDTHFSPETSDYMAQLVAKRIKSKFGADIPGKPIELGMVQDEETPHEGDLQRMLGLKEESQTYKSLYCPERRSRIVRTDRGQTYLAESQAPIVWCGTSYSHVGDMAERLSYYLQREVEDEAVPGQGPTVKLMEVLDQVQRGERDTPEVIIWEFPEKHVFVRVSSFLDPLNQFLLRDARGDDIGIEESIPLDYADVQPTNVELKQESDGAISGSPTSGDPYIAFKLKKELNPGPGQVLVYHVTSNRNTTSKVMFDFGSGFTRDGSLRVAIPKSKTATRVIIPLPERTIHRIRIDPVDTQADFILGRVSVARRSKP